MLNLNGWWASLSTLGPPAMFFVTIADTAALPTAQAVDLAILVQAAAAPERSIELGLYAVAGSTLGAMILYFAACKAGAKALTRKFSEERVERVRTKLARYDALALAVPVALPLPFVPMKVFVACAGVLELDAFRTAVTVAAARAVRYFGLIFLGRWLGADAWPVIRENAVIASVACIVLVALYVFLDRRRQASATSEGADARDEGLVDE